jgi:hypothetical protein
MKIKLLEDIRKFLSTYDGFFHNEKEIQVRLAKYLIDLKKYDQIFLEYTIEKSQFNENYLFKNENKISLDIVVRNQDEFIPIEIKYKTTNQNFSYSVFGKNTNVCLTHHGAKNLGCYSFWKDVYRLELIQQTFNLNELGIVLFITNDEKYKVFPRIGSKYQQFSIHEGKNVTAGEVLYWSEKYQGKNYPDIPLSNNNSINWDDNINIINHSFILI